MGRRRTELPSIFGCLQDGRHNVCPSSLKMPSTTRSKRARSGGQSAPTSPSKRAPASPKRTQQTVHANAVGPSEEAQNQSRVPFFFGLPPPEEAATEPEGVQTNSCSYITPQPENPPMLCEAVAQPASLVLPTEEEQASLECPVCYSWMQPPFRQCNNEHPICSECRPSYEREECPICRVSIESNALQPNEALEALATRLSLPCANGCGEVLSYAVVRPHGTNQS